MLHHVYFIASHITVLKILGVVAVVLKFILYLEQYFMWFFTLRIEYFSWKGPAMMI